MERFFSLNAAPTSRGDVVAQLPLAVRLLLRSEWADHSYANGAAVHLLPDGKTASVQVLPFDVEDALAERLWGDKLHQLRMLIQSLPLRFVLLFLGSSN